jgi:hypothetical protein
MNKTRGSTFPVPEAGQAPTDQNLGDVLAQRLTPEEWTAHVARVKEARGKFAHVFSSLEERMQRRQEEIDLEEPQSASRLERTPE